MNLNLGEIKAAGRSSQKTELDDGHYKMNIDRLDVKNGRVLFILKVTDGDYAGCSCITSLKIAESITDGVIYYWRAAAESVGWTSDQISGISEWTGDHFLNRIAHVRFTKGDRDKGIYDRVELLPPAIWEESAENGTVPPNKPASARKPTQEVSKPKEKAEKPSQGETNARQKLNTILDMNDMDMPF
jgi:hypothetical protein